MKTKSFLRIKEYEMLSKLHVDGKILDIGGSKKSGYQELIQGNHVFIVSNIDASYDVDVLFDAQQKWPFEVSDFSAVFFINVLEHVYDYKTAVTEAHRVLKSGGRMVGVVPFMYNVHGSPSDYFRYTRFALEKICIDAGFSSVTVHELGSGAFSVIHHNLFGFMVWPWFAHSTMYICEKLDRLLLYLRPNNKMSAKDMPLGYYFEATK